MKVSVTKHLGRYSLTSTEKSWSVQLRVDGRNVSVHWDEEDEPDTEYVPPTEIVEMMRGRIAEYIYWGGKEKAEEVFRFVEENSVAVNKAWAEQEMDTLNRQISRLQNVYASLRSNYVEAQ